MESNRAMTVEVIRAFDGHQPGDVLDASGWLWTEQLIQQHYIRPVSAPAGDTRAAKRRGNEA